MNARHQQLGHSPVSTEPPINTPVSGNLVTPRGLAIRELVMVLSAGQTLLLLPPLIQPPKAAGMPTRRQGGLLSLQDSIAQVLQGML